MVMVDKVVNMRYSYLTREAWVNPAAFCAFFVKVYLGSGSETFSGLNDLQTAFAAVSTKFRFAFFALSNPFFITFISSISSTSPFSQLFPTIRCLMPGPDCILDFGLIVFSVFPAILTSINVLRHLFLQK